MNELISSYNESPHKGLNYKIPNEITAEDELYYIKEKSLVKNPYDFQEGDKVRIVNDKDTFSKRITQVSPKAYTIDGKKGNLFKISSLDKSKNEYPGYKLVRSKGNIPFAEDLKEGKRGDVIEIHDYKNGKYTVLYEGGKSDNILPRDLREGNPTKISRIEREYWIKNVSKIPKEMRKMF